MNLRKIIAPCAVCPSGLLEFRNIEDLPISSDGAHRPLCSTCIEDTVYLQRERGSVCVGALRRAHEKSLFPPDLELQEIVVELKEVYGVTPAPALSDSDVLELWEWCRRIRFYDEELKTTEWL